MLDQMSTAASSSSRCNFFTFLSVPSFFRGSFDGTPLPWSKLFPVMLLIACESFNGNSIFAYVAFMVRDFGLVGPDDTERAGYYVGFIASVYFIAQFLSSFFWGRMSDRFGRRPVLLFGGTGQVISALAFGFSMNLPWAIVGRSLNGLLNGNIGVVKTYVGEVTDSTNQARAFGLISLFGGAGGIRAAIGGFTARLGVKFPEQFSNTIWATFPYLMPNLIATSVTLLGLILAYFLVTEPRHDQMVGMHALNSNDDCVELENEDEEPLQNSTSTEHLLLSNDDLSTTNLASPSTESHSSSSSLFARLKAWFSSSSGTRANADYSQLSASSRNSKIVRKSLQRETSITTKSAQEPFTAIFFERNAVISCCLYALLGFEHTVYDEVMPLLISDPVSKGGLAFNTTRIGAIGAAAGCTTVVIQLFVFPILAKKWGMVACFRYGSLISLAPFFLLPYLNLLPNQFHFPIATAWAPLLIMIVVKGLASNIAFSAVMSLIVNSVYYHQMGSANGLGQSLVALTRAAAPVIGGPLLAWGSHNGLPFPLNRNFIFNLLSLLCLVNVLASATLPLSVNKPRAEVDGDNPVVPTSLALHEDEPSQHHHHHTKESTTTEPNSTVRHNTANHYHLSSSNNNGDRNEHDKDGIDNGDLLMAEDEIVDETAASVWSKTERRMASTSRSLLLASADEEDGSLSILSSPIPITDAQGNTKLVRGLASFENNNSNS